MSKTLEDLLLNSIVEVYDGNSKSPDYSQQYIKNLMQARFIDIELDDGIVHPEELYAYLVKFSQSNEDEIEINYEDGQSITLDHNVVKELITYISTEEIQAAAIDIQFMHNIIYRVYNNNVVAIKGEV